MNRELEIYHGDGNKTVVIAPNISKTKYARDKDGTPIMVGGWADSGGGFVSAWANHNIQNDYWRMIQEEIKRSDVLYDGPEMGAHTTAYQLP